ncbi:HD superfamily hydrolase [Loigolactobacillus bifermentans DSM 20003]|uniref:HD superfamily hydrolase n=2 Tax=Loigolactobacillus bifermentans TaxID=1607 RepID=A0A0R1H396_9LACO|nr:HD superfamily hydrolase [Loigolactobacillus bifermentans DSM 20003]QGG59790.1 HD domain-containing protein [Loigolactobacillus bifermentans]
MVFWKGRNSVNLSQQEQAWLTAATTYMQQTLGQDQTGHSIDHINRVVRLAGKIAQAEQQPLFMPLFAATLHDVIDPKLFDQPAQARQALTTFLNQIQVPVATQQALWAIIDHMSFRKNLEQPQQLTLAGQIVQDADRLDAIGAIGIGRTFYYGGHFGDPMYDPTLPPRQHLTAAEYAQGNSTVINHFYEKLLRLAQQMNTPTGQQLAAQRQAFMETFLTRFKAEWEG